MDITFFKEFVTLAEQKNYLQTAEDLYIAQSVLSRHIQKLERELGVPLFIRTTKNVQLSEYGEIFLPYAKQIVQTKENYEQALSEHKSNLESTLRIGSVSALTQYKITDLIIDFKKHNKHATINIELGRSSGLFKMLRDGKCDVAFIREAEQMDPFLEEEFVRIPYAEDSLVAVMPADHPLSKSSHVNLALLKNESFLLLGTDNMPYHLCKNACLRCGFEPHVALTNRQPETLIELVRSGMGIALLMKPLAEFFKIPGIAICDIEPTVKSYLSLFYLKDKPLSPITKRFIRYFKKELSDIHGIEKV